MMRTFSGFEACVPVFAGASARGGLLHCVEGQSVDGFSAGGGRKRDSDKIIDELSHGEFRSGPRSPLPSPCKI